MASASPGTGKIPAVSPLVESNPGPARNPTSCFPAASTVRLASGVTVTLSKLLVGDLVESEPGIFSPVFFFSHRDPSTFSTHISLTLANNVTLTLSPGHFLPVYDDSSLMAARNVRVGQKLRTVSGWSDVIEVRRVIARGLYNPHTLTGTIVVDDVVVSVYTEAVVASVATTLLVPLRALFRAGLLPTRLATSALASGSASLPACIVQCVPSA